MAGLNRRFTFAAFALPFLFIAMAGLARANTIVVNTLDSGSQFFPLCTLEDAVLAAETQTIHGGCPAGTGNDDTIEFIVTGTIFPDNTLTLNNSSETLFIEGPPFGGITIDGQNNIELVVAEDTDLEVQNLTFTNGVSEEVGGAINAVDSFIGIEDCTFVNNSALGGGAFAAFESLVFFLNDTFTGNSAELGGGIFNEDAEFGVSNCTFSMNSAGGGADISTELLGETVANSTIFASTGGNNCDGVGDNGFNISNDNSCSFASPSVNNSTMLNLDPLGLQNNGGPTQTIALEAGSQAIDFVPIASCTGPFDEPVTDDQRLFNRPDSNGGVPESFCDAGAYESGAVAPIVLAPNTEKLQIARSSAANSDKVNTGFTFIYNGDPDCDSDEDALNSGVGVALFEGTCASLPASGLVLLLDPFQVHTVNHQQYGTLFQSFGPETVSARMVALPTPAGACGAWTLNLEVAGLDTPGLGLGGNGPFALVITDVYGDVEEVGVASQALTLADILGDAAGCFDITNAIVGDQIPTPGHSVRRGVRRSSR
jgi:hypothetical protein